MLEGRDTEIATIDRLLAATRDGGSQSLVVLGEPGIGKSALLEHAAKVAEDTGMRVLRGVGVETESLLPFAGLHLVLSGVLDRVTRLPAAQSAALGTALGLSEGTAAGNPFVTGLAVLTLLADLADERPLLCLIDDAHWLDQESSNALLFSARRLGAERVAIVFAAREDGFAAPGLPELRLGGLDDEAAARVLARRADDLPAHTRELILKQARGNPLALVELPTAQRDDERYASPYGMTALPAHSRLLRTFAGNAGALPEAAQTLLLTAAADDTGDLATVLAAAGRFGVRLEDLEDAESARLIHVTDGRVVFRHPVIRTAVYQSATAGRRIAVHRALADAMAARRDLADQRAWHLAAAGIGPDEHAAELLERSAERARRRGGSHAVAAAYERAAALSPEPGPRGRRLTLAARAAADAGRLDHADTLAAEAADLLSDPLDAVEAVRVRAAIADEQDRSKAAHGMLVEFAPALAERAPDEAGALLFQAAQAAWHAGDQQAIDTTADLAKSLALPQSGRIAALARLAAGQHHLEDVADGAAAVRELLAGSPEPGEVLRESVRLGWWHLFNGDLHNARDLAADLERQCRDQGAIGVLCLVQMLLARACLLLGRHRDALTVATDGLRNATDTGQARVQVYIATILAHLDAVRGDEDACREHTDEALARGIAPSSVHAACALSLLDLGLGRAEAALDRLVTVASAPDRQGVFASLPDLVEAAVRAGQPEQARQAAAWYGRGAAHSRQSWHQALALRCEALLATDPQTAEARYERAVRLHQDASTSPFELARTRLLYGEWLRRARRATDARTQLRAALQAFEQLGAVPWAERARTELRATGESVLTRAAPDVLDRLTPQELHVARLAAQGLTNRDIGARLFISPRTAGYHLSNAYHKLGINSRTELARLAL
ncbi:helix-turn-helix transcriptional regulator [Nonomuraea indica]|uniref:AAA family ATPase n=1 Tax=Nonomuraea indica TaxID=1581193 RepID=A0ABW8A5Q6_9ACTN